MGHTVDVVGPGPHEGNYAANRSGDPWAAPSDVRTSTALVRNSFAGPFANDKIRRHLAGVDEHERAIESAEKRLSDQ